MPYWQFYGIEHKFSIYWNVIPINIFFTLTDTAISDKIQEKRTYHSCYSFFVINFALAKSKTVFSKIHISTGIAYENNKIVFIHDNNLHDIIFMRVT